MAWAEESLPDLNFDVMINVLFIFLRVDDRLWGRSMGGLGHKHSRAVACSVISLSSNHRESIMNFFICNCNHIVVLYPSHRHLHLPQESR